MKTITFPKRGALQILREKHGAQVVGNKMLKATFLKGAGIICVMDQGNTESVAYCETEFDIDKLLALSSVRFKSWMFLPKSEAEKLSGVLVTAGTEAKV
jgi:hypothetical protein